MLADGTRAARPEETTFSAWRDAQGRVRTEWPPHGIAPGGVEIKDPTSGYVYNLDFVNHVAYRTSLAPGAATTASQPAALPTGEAAAGATVNVLQLGTQVIAGVPATGVRTAIEKSTGASKPIVTEIWTARDEGVVLLEKNTTATGDDVTIALKNFSTREPDASLFRVPATYQIIDEYGNQIQAKQ